MAYASQEAKDKAVAVKEAEVAKLQTAVDSQTERLARYTRTLNLAKADLEHRKTAPVADPVDVPAEAAPDDLLAGLTA